MLRGDLRPGAELRPALPAGFDAADGDDLHPHAPGFRESVVAGDPQVRVARRDATRAVAHEESIASVVELHERAFDARVEEFCDRVEPEGVIDPVRVGCAECLLRIVSSLFGVGVPRTAGLVPCAEQSARIAPAKLDEASLTVPDVVMPLEERPSHGSGSVPGVLVHGRLHRPRQCVGLGPGLALRPRLIERVAQCDQAKKPHNENRR